ncbi:XisI protein [Candidatus Parabeggiatoa sp. HSG14]|uniref:XisI protein n=1 Tax=Candidatus Parabeggiatoa sp. HSG14 TaxID=3055593 RepID=UPI0025A92A80|nr:XisI protein [Thiotrichales bacterium HSG14]
MDTLNAYRQIIQNVLSQHIQTKYANADLQNQAIFDSKHDSYCVLSTGWADVKRIHSCLIHIDVIDNLLWIQQDGTEDGIAYELEEAGIPKSSIVLGFHEPKVRQYTGYAVA